MNLGEITKAMQELNNWALDSDTITKDFEFNTFKDALDFVNKVGEIAEKLSHHPDIVIGFNKVKLTLTTHSEGTLTEQDFEVAKEIDSLK